MGLSPDAHAPRMASRLIYAKPGGHYLAADRAAGARIMITLPGGGPWDFRWPVARGRYSAADRGYEAWHRRRWRVARDVAGGGKAGIFSSGGACRFMRFMLAVLATLRL